MTAEPVDYSPDEPSPEEVAATLHDALADIAAATAVLGDMVPAYLELTDNPTSALLLQTMRGLRQQLAGVEAFTEADVAGRFGKGKHNIPGWLLEVRGGSKWTDWRHDDLAWRLLQDLAVDPVTGELDEVRRQVLDAARSRLLNCARTEWRLTQLGNYDIAPSDYAKWEPTRRTVAFTADEVT